MYGNNNNPAPGTVGGRCLPSVMIRGKPQPRCAAPSRCDTTFDKCMLPARRPIPKPAPTPGPSRKGYGDRCIPGAFPGSGLQANCKKGLVCKRSSPDVMPVCQYPSVKPNPPRPLGTFSYECEGTQCVLKKSPPNLKENRYSSLERCQAYCAPHHPSGLRSYECNPRRGYDGGGPDCIARDDGNGQYKTMEECNNKCVSARLRNPTWKCNPDRKDVLGSKRCLKVYDGTGRFASAEECGKRCGSATLRTGYSCPGGTKVGGGACVKVAGIPGNRGVFSNPTSCSEGSNCHAQPTSLMRDPYWSIGSVEPDPLMFMMSNVGDVGDRIQNFMGE